MTDPSAARSPLLGEGLAGKGVLVTGRDRRHRIRCGAHVCRGGGTRRRARPRRGLRARASRRPCPEPVTSASAPTWSTSAHTTSSSRQAEDQVGPLAALAHLAAFLRRRHDIREVDEADWDAQTDLNLKATFFLNRAFAERLRASARSGAIVNFSSQGWWTGGFGGSIVYNATKGGIVTMTRGLARTYAAAGIRVNAVAPGLVDTPMIRDDLAAPVLQSLVDQVPLGRLATAGGGRPVGRLPRLRPRCLHHRRDAEHQRRLAHVLMSPNRLSDLSRGEAADRGRAGAVCVLPVGSLEQHGEHLPVGTDSLLAETVSLRAADLALGDVVVAPTVWTGLSPHHVRLGVTVTLEPELLLELTRQIVRCLRPWFAAGRDRERARGESRLARRARPRRGMPRRQLLGARRSGAD